MRKGFILLLAGFMAAATVADAQSGGGRRGGGGGGGGRSQSRSTQSSSPATPERTPLSDIEVIGVVQAIDKTADRITIRYEPVDALNWPAGSMPFNVAKASLLQTVTVGEKVRFKLESQQISDLKPFEDGQKKEE